MSLNDFDKDGFPLIRRLADAYNGKEYAGGLSDEKFERQEVSYQFHRSSLRILTPSGKL
ncbi:hypothetical protein [Photobacterium damselae]|uniref:hypothetical protein n=1 Tax=Photobacterium damselae TaxID=38293 RepID=UPI0040684DCB